MLYVVGTLSTLFEKCENNSTCSRASKGHCIALWQYNNFFLLCNILVFFFLLAVCLCSRSNYTTRTCGRAWAHTQFLGDDDICFLLTNCCLSCCSTFRWTIITHLFIAHRCGQNKSCLQGWAGNCNADVYIPVQLFLYVLQALWASIYKSIDLSVYVAAYVWILSWSPL